MSQISREEMDEIRREIEAEFPADPALQEVHIARRILAREAEIRGMSFVEYVRWVVAQGRSGRVPR